MPIQSMHNKINLLIMKRRLTIDQFQRTLNMSNQKVLSLFKTNWIGLEARATTIRVEDEEEAINLALSKL